MVVVAVVVAVVVVLVVIVGGGPGAACCCYCCYLWWLLGVVDYVCDAMSGHVAVAVGLAIADVASAVAVLVNVVDHVRATTMSSRREA